MLALFWLRLGEAFHGLWRDCLYIYSGGFKSVPMFVIPWVSSFFFAVRRVKPGGFHSSNILVDSSKF